MRPELARASLFAFIVFVLGISSSAYAKDVCEQYRNYAPLPDWYNEYCLTEGGAKVGGAFSSFADSFNLNPASIPTAKGPYGVEYIGTYDASSTKTFKHNFALIKGLSRIGAGLSTNGDDTFYGNNQSQTTTSTNYSSNLQDAVSSGSVSPSFNLGAALSLLPKEIVSPVTPKGGLTIRYNKYNGKLSPGAGLSLASRHLTFGLSLVTEGGDQYTPSTRFYTTTIGFKTSRFQVEYLYLKNESDVLSSYFYTPSQPIHIVSASLSLLNFSMSGAAKRVINFDGAIQYYFHGAIQYQFSRYFAVAGLINYIPNTQSIGIQAFL